MNTALATSLATLGGLVIKFWAIEYGKEWMHLWDQSLKGADVSPSPVGCRNASF